MLTLEKERKYAHQAILTRIALISVVLISTLTWSQFVIQFFTAKDTLTLIDTSRINTFEDLGRIFTEPMMNGTEFVEIVKYYRPISQLTFSIDYFLWELNPYGFHLTNLLLHISISILIFILVQCLFKGNYVIAWISSILFNLHPALVESVPAIARRQDMLTTLFLLLSLIFMIKYSNANSLLKKHITLSIIFYILALGSKELAIILPFLTLSYFFLFTHSEEESCNVKIRSAIKLNLPFFVISFLWLFWRVLVLNGLGGPVDRFLGLPNIVIKSGAILKNYFEDVFLPVNHFSYFYLSPSNTLTKALTPLTIVFFMLVLILSRKLALKNAVSREKIGKDYINKILIGILFFASNGLLAFPWVSKVLGKTHLYGARDLYITLFALAAILSCFLIFGLNVLKKDERTNLTRSVIFLTTWLILPLCLFLLAQNYTHWNIYFSIIPFSIFIAIGFSEIYKSMNQELKRVGRRSNKTLRASMVGLVFLVSFSFSTYMFSPLCAKYSDWKESGRVISTILDNLLKIVEENPDVTTVHIHNLPRGIDSSDRKIPYVKSVTYLSGYSIKSWLDLHKPKNDVKIILHETSILEGYPQELRLETVEKKNKSIFINVVVE